MEVLIVSIFDILPLASKKKIFVSTNEKLFLIIFGLQRIPDANNRSDLKSTIVEQLLRFFEESTNGKDTNCLNAFFENLQSIFNVNLQNRELNDHILKLVNFLIGNRLGRNPLNVSLMLSICLKFLSNQDLQFRVDLIENMFEELQKNADGRIEYFYMFLNKLLKNENHRTITKHFIRTLRSTDILKMFVSNNMEKANPTTSDEMPFKRKKLDFTSTPLGKNSQSNEKCLEQSLEKMCFRISDLKANLKRPLTNVESSLTKKLIDNLQSML